MIKDKLNEKIFEMSNKADLEAKGEIISQHLCPKCKKELKVWLPYQHKGTDTPPNEALSNWIEGVGEEHQVALKELGLPPWLKTLNCPSCQALLPETAIRCVGLRTNTQHFGNIAVEYICNECSTISEIHFANQVHTMADCAKFVLGAQIDAEGVVIGKIPLQVHNIAKRIFSKKGARANNKK
jgi:uncharacterized protein with PIN domain